MSEIYRIYKVRPFCHNVMQNALQILVFLLFLLVDGWNEKPNVLSDGLFFSDLKVELDLEELQPRVGLGGQARYNLYSFC